MRLAHLFTLFGLVLAITEVASDNVGWKKYFAEDDSEFHDIKLDWALDAPVPSWLKGTYVRNGPAQISFNSSRRILTSWLDGFAKVHSFKFDEGRVAFSGRMLESPNYLASVKKGELTPQMTLNKFRTEKEEWSVLEKMEIMKMFVEQTAFDNNNPALWRIGPADKEKGIYMAVTDGPVPTRFNIDTLETMGMEYPNMYPITISACAHYMREPGTDNSIMLHMKKSLTGSPYAEVQRYRPQDTYQSPQVIATFIPKVGGYFHSFSITENHAVFFIYPVVVDALQFYAKNFHVFETLEQKEGAPTYIYVVNLKTGEVEELEAAPTYSLHHANAYEDKDGSIVVDLITNPYTAIRDYVKIDNMLNPPKESNESASNHQELQRYHLNLETKNVTVKVFADLVPADRYLNHFDFPIINEAHRGRPYCIVYGWSAYQYSRMTLTKRNLCDPEKSRVWTKENHYSSEMFFLAAPDAKEEDDGVLVTIVFDGEKEQSYLLLLDAKDLTVINMSYLPVNIPWSAHGMFFPEAHFSVGE